MIKSFLEIEKKNPRKTSFDLQKDLGLAGIRISSSTMRHTLLEVGRRAKKLLKKHLLSKKRRRKY